MVSEAAVAAENWSDVVFLDDDPASPLVVGCSVVGGLEQLSNFADDESEIIVAIGDNRTRLSLCNEIEAKGMRLAIVIHPSAVISPTASISRGSVVCAGAIVSARTNLGRGCIVNTGATVDHDCFIEDGVHISPGANLAGSVSVGECAWIGIGSALRDGVVVGRDVMVGAGSAVVSDISDGETVVGVPARGLVST